MSLLSLPLLFLLHHIVSLCWAKMDNVKGVLWFLQGDLETEILFLCVSVSSFFNNVSGRGEISAGKSLETFYPPQ